MRRKHSLDLVDTNDVVSYWPPLSRDWTHGKDMDFMPSVTPGMVTGDLTPEILAPMNQAEKNKHVKMVWLRYFKFYKEHISKQVMDGFSDHEQEFIQRAKKGQNYGEGEWRILEN